MDAIVAHASHGALLALRAASRAWCTRVDTILHAHVRIAPDHVPRASSGPIPLNGRLATHVETLDLVDLGPPGFLPPPPSPPPSSPSSSSSASSSSPTSPSSPLPSPPRLRTPRHPPLPPSVDTLRIHGDLDWTVLGPLLPSCTTLVLRAPLPLIQASIYTPRLATPRGLTDSAACAAFLSRVPRIVLGLSALRGASVYVLADVLRAREVVLLADGGEWRDALASLCCLMGAVLLNGCAEVRFTLVNVLETGEAWRRDVARAGGVEMPEGWGAEGFWAGGMGLFRLAGHEFAATDEGVRQRMERRVRFVSLEEYEAEIAV